MGNFFKNLLDLDLEASICIEQEELGGEKVILHKKKRYRIKIPEKINKKITLRLEGLGKKRGSKYGNLYLHLWLNKGEDLQKNLWISESCARNGTKKLIRSGGRKFRVTIPENSFHGRKIRLKGLGKKPRFDGQVSVKEKKRGNLLITLKTFPDHIIPKYGTIDHHTISELYLEGWVYRKVDEIIKIIGYKSLPACPIPVECICDTFNQYGWTGIFEALMKHTNLTNTPIRINKSGSISNPGFCKGTRTHSSDSATVTTRYMITIHEKYIHNPFTTAAILAHELCHVIYSEKLQNRMGTPIFSHNEDKQRIEDERIVDLLVFLYRMGEFQLRVARGNRLTLGYFDQKIFERMQVIVGKKLNSVPAHSKITIRNGS